jgi:hypothetical protein
MFNAVTVALRIDRERFVTKFLHPGDAPMTTRFFRGASLRVLASLILELEAGKSD